MAQKCITEYMLRHKFAHKKKAKKKAAVEEKEDDVEKKARLQDRFHYEHCMCAPPPSKASSEDYDHYHPYAGIDAKTYEEDMEFMFTYIEDLQDLERKRALSEKNKDVSAEGTSELHHELRRFFEGCSLAPREASPRS